MRIKTLYVKNFKSIDELKEVNLRDMSILCIIGRNGSGKSNFLYAIKSLKDNEFLVDGNRYDKVDRDDLITISSIIELDKRDVASLDKYGLKLSDLNRFRITTTKREGEDPERTFEPIDFTFDFSEKIDSKTKEIIKIIEQSGVLVADSTELIDKPEETAIVDEISTEVPGELNQSDSNKEIISSLISLHKDFVANKEGTREEQNKKTANYLKALSSFVTIPNILSKEVNERLTALVNETYSLITFDIASFLEKDLWDSITINLLDLGSYLIETSAKETDLHNFNKHPFLFDLLSLTEKSAKDFVSNGSELSNTQRDASQNLSRKLAGVWPKHTVDFKVEAQRLNIFFSFETPQKRSRGLKDLSAGEQWFLRFYTKLAIATNEKKQIIWLFDEPGQFLHATSQIDLKLFFEETTVNSQIIYTSHQPMMIQWHRLERILVAENNPNDGTTISSRLWTDHDLISPLREALGLFVGEQMLTGVEHVVVEGISDYIHMQGWLLYFQKTRTGKHWQTENSSLNRSYIPAGGRDCIPLYLLFLTKKTKDKVSTIAIPDSKEDADKVKQAMTDYGLDTTKKRVKSISELVGSNDIRDIEDLYEKEEILKLVSEFYKINYPLVKFSKTFLTPSTKDVEYGIVSYIDNHMNSNNPDYFEDKSKKLSLDKPGIAFLAYEKLIAQTTPNFSKTTEKLFEKLFTSINGFFS